jgi:uncharacterized membrane protein
MSEDNAGFSKGRLEAFSDGVIAVIVTLMVLDLKAPESDGFDELAKVLPSFLAYLISFIFAALYWINHHGLLIFARRVTTQILWANNLLLFCISLFPFATSYMAATRGGVTATALYGIVQLACGISFMVLTDLIAAQHTDDAVFLARQRALARKNRISTTLYILAIPAAFVSPYLSIAIFVTIATIYISPWLLVVKTS